MEFQRRFFADRFVDGRRLQLFMGDCDFAGIFDLFPLFSGKRAELGEGSSGKHFAFPVRNIGRMGK